MSSFVFEVQGVFVRLQFFLSVFFFFFSAFEGGKERKKGKKGKLRLL